MAFSSMFFRRDGLDALISNDPSFDHTVEKIDESAIDNDEFNLFEEADRLAGISEEGLTDEVDDDSITELLDGDDCYDSSGTDMVDDYADDIHAIDIPDNIENMEIGDMIDSLMD